MSIIAGWVDLIYNTIVLDLFGGNQLLVGLGAMIFMGFFGFKMRMSFDAIGISMVALLLFLAGIGFLPVWIIPVILLVLGGLIAMGLLRFGRR